MRRRSLRPKFEQYDNAKLMVFPMVSVKGPGNVPKWSRSSEPVEYVGHLKLETSRENYTGQGREVEIVWSFFTKDVAYVGRDMTEAEWTNPRTGEVLQFQQLGFPKVLDDGRSTDSARAFFAQVNAGSR